MFNKKLHTSQAKKESEKLAVPCLVALFSPPVGNASPEHCNTCGLQKFSISLEAERVREVGGEGNNPCALVATPDFLIFTNIDNT